MVHFDSGSESDMTNGNGNGVYIDAKHEIKSKMMNGDVVHTDANHEVKPKMINGNGVHNEPRHDQFQDHVEMEVLTLPDLFCSLMSVPVRENPNYASAKADADAWIAS